MASSKIALLKRLGISAAVGGAAVLGTPVLISAAGFGAGGIAAGTIAAKLMALSTSYGVGAGVVGTFQSIGAAGALTAAQTTITWTSVFLSTLKALKCKDKKSEQDGGKDDKKDDNHKR